MFSTILNINYRKRIRGNQNDDEDAKDEDPDKSDKSEKTNEPDDLSEDADDLLENQESEQPTTTAVSIQANEVCRNQA